MIHVDRSRVARPGQLDSDKANAERAAAKAAFSGTERSRLPLEVAQPIKNPVAGRGRLPPSERTTPFRGSPDRPDAWNAFSE